MTSPSEKQVFVNPGQRVAASRAGSSKRTARRIETAPSAVAGRAVLCQTSEPGRKALSDFTDGEEDQRASLWKDRSTNVLGVPIPARRSRTTALSTAAPAGQMPTEKSAPIARVLVTVSPA